MLSGGSFALSTGAVEYSDCFSASVNQFPVYDTKQSDGEASVILEILGMLINPSSPSFQGPIWPGVIALDTVLSMSQIEF